MKFRIRSSTNQFLSIGVLKNLVDAYEKSDEEFLEIVKKLVELAKKEGGIEEFGGGGILDLFVLPNGVIYVGHSVMCLDLVED